MLILINSPMQILGHTGSETVFRLKHKLSPLTRLSTLKYLKIIYKFDVMYSEALFFMETYL